MLFLKILLIVIEVLCSLLLIGLVLLQRSKSEGLGLAFGSQMGESLFGAQAGNVLVKATIWLGLVFLVNTTLLAKVYSQGAGRSLMSERSAPAAPRPAAPASPASAPVAPPVSSESIPIPAAP